MTVFSLRLSLQQQGVSTEEGMRRHLSHVHGTMGAVPVNIRRYRIDPSNPEFVSHG